MADSSVLISQGSGTPIDTRTESSNSNHRQVVVLGDPSANGGVAPVDASTGLSVNVTNTSITIADGGSTISVDDGAGSLTVDGTVAATQSGAWNVTNISGTVSLPTGAATDAKQDTGNTSLSSIDTKLATAKTADLDSGAGTDTVQIVGIALPGSGGAVVGGTSTNPIQIGDAGGSLTVDGTVAATQSGTWNVTDISGTISLPTGAATSAKQDTIITSVQLIDDSVYTDGSGTPSKGIAVMGTDGTNPQIISTTSAGLVNIADGGGNISIDDGGNTITVDGTVTANLGTLNGAATAVKQPALGTAGTASSDVITVQGIASMTALLVDGSATTQPVSGTITADAGTGFPPVITDGSAAGTTGIHILGTDGTNGQIIATDTSGNIKTVIQTGTNTIGSVKITDGTDVADVLDLTNSNPLTVAIVDGSGDQITSIGGGTEYNVDDVAGATNAGKLALVVRDDALATLTPVDGDYTQMRTNSRGALWIKPDGVVSIDDNSSSITVDGTITANAGTGFVPLITDGSTAGTVGIHILGTDGTNGQIISTNTSGHVNIADGGNTITVDGTVTVTDGSGSLTVDGTVAATQSGAWTVQPGNTANTTPWLVSLHDGTTKASILDLTNNNPITTAIVDGNGDQITSFGGGTQYTEDAAAAANPVGTALMLVREDARAGSLTTTDGDNVAARGNNKGELYVKHTDTIAVTQSGTWDEVGINDSGNSITVDGTITASNTSGDIASGSADSGNPVKVGGKYNSTLPTFTTGQRGDLQIGSRGSLNATLMIKDSTLAVNAAVDNADDVAVSTNADKLTVISRNTVFDGTTWDRMPGTSADGVLVNLGANNDITGTVAVSNGASAAAPIYSQLIYSGNNIAGLQDDADAISTGAWGLRTIAESYGFNGTTWDRLRSDTTNGLDVDVTRLPALVAGTAIIGKVGHDITGIGHGVTTVTTAGTDVALATSTACKKVIIQAQTDNTTGIAVGATGVDATVATGTGIFLYPGDSIELEIDNLADIFIDSLTNGEGVRYTYFT